MSDLEPREVGGIIAGFLLALGGALAALRKWLGPDYKAMAREFFAEKAAADEEHRDALAEEIRKLGDVMRSELGATRRELREVNDSTRNALGTLLQSYQALLVGIAAKVDVLILRNGGKP